MEIEKVIVLASISLQVSRCHLRNRSSSMGQLKSASGSFADIDRCLDDVCSVPGSGHQMRSPSPKSAPWPHNFLISRRTDSICVISLSPVSVMREKGTKSFPAKADYVPGLNASTAILRTIADAGSARSANRPARSRERVGHVLTCNVMGRCGMGVGFHTARRWTSLPSTNHRTSHGSHSIAYLCEAFDASNPNGIAAGVPR